MRPPPPSCCRLMLWPAAGSDLFRPFLPIPSQTARAKVLSNSIKQKRKEKAGKWEVPLPKARLRDALHAAVLLSPGSGVQSRRAGRRCGRLRRTRCSA